MQKFPKKQYDCYHIGADVYQTLLENYFYRMIRIGFKKIFVLAGHYPNAEIAILASMKYKDSGIKFVVVKEPDLVNGEIGDHAGKWETSLMMYLYPDLVDLKRMDNKEDRLMAVEGIDPISASKEYGEQMLKVILAKIEALLAKELNKLGYLLRI